MERRARLVGCRNFLGGARPRLRPRGGPGSLPTPETSGVTKGSSLMLHVSFRVLRALCLSFALLSLLAAVSIQADQIVVDGKEMSGKVVKVTSKGLDVETTYGKGNVLVPYDKITTL